MQVQQISNQQPNFGMKFKLSDRTMQVITKSTRLSQPELTQLTTAKQEKLMKKYGTLKELGKVKTWLSRKYKAFGETLRLLEKKHY